MEATIDMLVEQARHRDELHGETGIEHDEFEFALMTFMQSDPEVREAMQTYMRNMRDIIDEDPINTSEQK